jgi:hypothetical protein
MCFLPELKPFEVEHNRRASCPQRCTNKRPTGRRSAQATSSTQSQVWLLNEAWVANSLPQAISRVRMEIRPKVRDSKSKLSHFKSFQVSRVKGEEALQLVRIMFFPQIFRPGPPAQEKPRRGNIQGVRGEQYTVSKFSSPNIEAQDTKQNDFIKNEPPSDAKCELEAVASLSIELSGTLIASHTSKQLTRCLAGHLLGSKVKPMQQSQMRSP